MSKKGMYNMKHLALITILALLFIPVADARLGETVKKCKKRYGPPTEEKATQKGLTKVYRKGDFVVEVEFGLRQHVLFFKTMKAVAITYSKLAPNTRTRHVPLSEEEIGTFLEVNMQGESWKDVNMMMEVARHASSDDQARLLQKADDIMIWRREDGGAATYGKASHELVIRSPREEDSGEGTGKGHELDGF
jgi:hypothetical protein